MSPFLAGIILVKFYRYIAASDSVRRLYIGSRFSMAFPALEEASSLNHPVRGGRDTDQNVFSKPL